MKKLGHILLSILFVFPMLVGMCFLTPETAPATPNGGGGGNSLISEEAKQDSLKDAESNNEYVVTYKTYDDYFLDFEVHSKIEDTTITGAGSSSDPFVLNSTEDFLFLAKSGLSWRYMKLNCDVVLNDETFDENGNPTGGDGIVYKWTMSNTFYDYCIDGCGFKISGGYLNEPTQSYTSFFGRNLQTVENLVIDNVFICGSTYVYGMAMYTKDIINCEVRGTIKGGTSVAGFAFYASGKLINSVNRASVFASSNDAAGFTVSSYDKQIIKGNINYGNITGNNHVSGIVRAFYQRTRIVDCVNYGTITALSAYAGGIFSTLLGNTNQDSRIFVGCINYGKIVAPDVLGGIAANLCSNTMLLNCKNYGYICQKAQKPVACGELVGRIESQWSRTDANIMIKDCVVDSLTNGALVGQMNGGIYGFTARLKIRNVKHYSRNVGEGYNKVICNQIANNNHEFDIDGLYAFHDGKDLKLFQYPPHSKIKIRNVVFELNTDEIITDSYVAYNTHVSTEIEIVKGMVISTNKGVCFYGSDFSDFFVDFKTGKIGLKSFSGKGFFQGKVTEEWLMNMGYEKKTI